MTWSRRIILEARAGNKLRTQYKIYEKIEFGPNLILNTKSDVFLLVPFEDYLYYFDFFDEIGFLLLFL